MAGQLIVSVSAISERTLGDIAGVRDELASRSVPVSLLARHDLLHVWPIFVPFLPEAREDLVKVVRFISAH